MLRCNINRMHLKIVAQDKIGFSCTEDENLGDPPQILMILRLDLYLETELAVSQTRLSNTGLQHLKH